MALAPNSVRNDRKAVSNNIQALHGVVAVLTHQPIMNLTSDEGDAMSSALCAVLDHHNIDLMKAGGALGLYATLAMTVYMVEAPRLKALRAGATKTIAPSGLATKPANGFDASQTQRPMDFTADLDPPPPGEIN